MFEDIVSSLRFGVFDVEATCKLRDAAADEIERLRAKVDSLRLLTNTYHDIGEDLAVARGEVDRLRAALQTIVNNEPYRDAWSIDVARAALAGEKKDDKP